MFHRGIIVIDHTTHHKQHEIKGGLFTTANTKIEYIEENIDKVWMGKKGLFLVESQLIFVLYIYNVGPALFRLGGTTRDNVDLIGNVILRSPLAGYL